MHAVCQSGCQTCVWEVYHEALKEWDLELCGHEVRPALLYPQWPVLMLAIDPNCDILLNSGRQLNIKSQR